MPDITKCEGASGPIKEECYRFLALPSGILQSYFAPPYTDGGCEYFLRVSKKDKLEQKEQEAQDGITE